MDLRRLQHFVTIARLRSYHRAAEHLHLSQPALSRSIQALEAQYQVRLFDRGRGGIELTSIGAQLLKRAEDLLHNAGSMEELLRGAAEGVNGQVSFGIGPVAASRLLPGILTELISRHPQLSVRVTMDTVEAMTRQLLNGDIEFYLGVTHPSQPLDRLHVRPLGSATPRMLVRPGHPLTGIGPVQIKQLLEFPKIAVSSWNDSMQYIEMGEHRDALRASIELDGYELLTKIVLASDSILIGSFWDPQEGLELLEVADIHELPSSSVAIFALRARTQSPAALMLSDRLALAYRASTPFGVRPGPAQMLPYA